MMRGYDLGETARQLGGRASDPALRYARVSTDTRRLQAGDLYVALRGERFDGHDFIAEAERAGAAAALVSRPVATSLPTLEVDDTLVGLGRLGRMNRQQFTGPLIGVTGSSGKTGTKEMLAAILSECGVVLATEGNYNNEIGVPLTLLRLAPEHRFAVIEMACGKPGDIAYLAELALPGVAVVTNAMAAHIEYFGSVEAIARTKGELFAALADDGVAVLNADDTYADLWRELIGARRTVSWSLGERPATLHARGIRVDAARGTSFGLVTPDWTREVSLALIGRHQVGNALAAAGAAWALGVEADAIVRGLAAVRPMAGRLRSLPGRGGSRLIDDSYNANPGSMRAAIDLLAGVGGRRILAIGGMAELGADSRRLHAEIGAYARGHGIDALYATGDDTRATVETFGDGARHFADRTALLAALRGELDAHCTVLVKGSRSAAMDEVVAGLCEERN